MYEINMTEYQSMPYPPFDNSTPMVLNGTLNGSTLIDLKSYGYINAVVEVRGMDFVMGILTAILVLLIFIFALMLWDHYIRTWGGRKNI